MTVKVTMSLEGFKIIDDYLKYTGEELRDLRTPLKRSGVYMYGSIDRNFRAGGRPSPWAPLSPRTIENRRQNSDKPLQDTGRLKGSVSDQHHPDAVYELTQDSLIMGTKLAYASTHQEGGTFTIPAHTRPLYFAWSDEYNNYLFSSMEDADFFIDAQYPARQVRVPQRVFMLFHPEDETAIQDIFGDYVEEVIEDGR